MKRKRQPVPVAERGPHHLVFIGRAKDGTEFWKCICGCGWEGER